MSRLKNELILLGHELEQESEAAHDLWSWLPSFEAAKKNHGDYAVEFTPSTTEVMRETAKVLSALRGHECSRASVDWFGCPCEEHPETADQIAERFEATWGVELKLEGRKS